MEWLQGALGLALLVLGGELLVRGAVRVALTLGLSPSIVGLTVVATGTSLPELLVSLQSAWRGQVGIAVGNIVGSNIFNILAILGMVGLVRPARLSKGFRSLDWPALFASALVLHLVASNGAVSRLEGAALTLLYVAYVGLLVHRERAGTPDAEGPPPPVAKEPKGCTVRALALTAGGLVALGAGASFFVQGASTAARTLGVSETVIGLTIVAAGTSLPELFASLTAAVRGQSELAIGNVVGSNIFNAAGITGLTALVAPLEVPATIVLRDDWWMLAASLALLLGTLRARTLGRLPAASFTVAYAVYVGLLVRSG